MQYTAFVCDNEIVSLWWKVNMLLKGLLQPEQQACQFFQAVYILKTAYYVYILNSGRSGLFTIFSKMISLATGVSHRALVDRK